MIELRFTKLPLPCPTNQLYRAFLGKGMKFPRTILSQRARKLRQVVVGSLLAQLKGRRPALSTACSIDYVVTFPDKRPRDIDCYEKQLLDCLQHAGVISNDKIVAQISKQSVPQAQRPGWIDLTLRELP
jgi:Holliday junction resolvase RusA-like endonuclease